MEQLKVDFDKVIESLKLSEESINSRKKNFNKFVENGFPNKRVEDWKFSDLNQIISANIENLSFYNDVELGEIDEAIKHYYKVISISPNYAEAHHNLGNILNDLGQTTKQLKVMKRHYLLHLITLMLIIIWEIFSKSLVKLMKQSRVMKRH